MRILMLSGDGKIFQKATVAYKKEAGKMTATAVKVAAVKKAAKPKTK
jgi:hypothetical protein